MLNSLLTSPRRKALCALLSFSFFASAYAGSAQEQLSKSHVEEVLQGLGRGHGLGPVAVSPDGTKIAYVRQMERNWQVMVAPFGDLAKSTRVTAGKKDETDCGEGSVAWGPDSRHLAFLGNCPGGASQDDVFVAAFESDSKYSVERLTDAHGEVGYPYFSPDGSKIAFLYVDGATRAAGALAAMKPWAGVIGEDGVEVQRVAMVCCVGSRGQAGVCDSGQSACL